MNINDVFDRVVCINLDRRPDRWDNAKAQFAANEIAAERVPAVDGKGMDMTGRQVSPGAAGCSMSHRAVLSQAIDDEVERLMVFEDDVVFDPNFKRKFSDIYDMLPDDWDIMYLGHNKIGIPPPTLLVPGAVRLHGALSTHAIGFNGIDVMKRLLWMIDNSPLQVDVVYANAHAIFNVVGFSPVLAKQKEDYSDIEGTVMNYDYYHGLFGD